MLERQSQAPSCVYRLADSLDTVLAACEDLVKGSPEPNSAIGLELAAVTHIMQARRLIDELNPLEPAVMDQCTVFLAGTAPFAPEYFGRGNLAHLPGGVIVRRAPAPLAGCKRACSRQPVICRRMVSPLCLSPEASSMSASTDQELKRQLAVARDQQIATSNILRVISQSPSNVQPVFDAVVSSAVRLLGAYAGALTRVAGDQIELAALTSVDDAGDDLVRAVFPLSLQSEMPHARAVRNCAPINISDAQSDPSLTEKSRGIARARGYRSWVIVPLPRRGEAIGTISVTRRKAGGFDENEIALLRTFAEQAVIAIENTRLFEETKEALERQTATASILSVISGSPTSVRPVFEAILENACRLCGSQLGAIFRYDRGLLHIAATKNWSAEAVEGAVQSWPRAPDNRTTSGRAVLTKDVIINEDTLADPDYDHDSARRGGWRRMLGVPMLRENNVIGVIVVTWREAGPIMPKQIDLLKAFADQAVIAIENTRLFEAEQASKRELQESLQYQTATGDVLNVISRSPTSLQPVLDTIVATAQRLCDTDRGSVWIRDGEVYRLAASIGNDPATVQYFLKNPISPGRHSLIGRVALTSKTVHVPAVMEDNELTFPRDRPTITPASMLGVPLVRDNRPIGAIGLSRTTASPFTHKQIALVETFADQAVIAIENTRLFEAEQASRRELQESLDYQTAISEVLGVISRSKFDLQPVMDTIVATASRLIGADRGGMRRRVGVEYRNVSMYGYSDEEKLYLREQLSARGLPELHRRTIETKQTIQLDDYGSDPSTTMPDVVKRLGVQVALGVPLLREGELIGTMGFHRTEKRPFTPRQIELVNTFADQAVIAIENTRLFEAEQASKRELQESLEYQTAISEVLEVISRSRFDLKPILDAIVSAAGRLCQADMVNLRRREGDRFRHAASMGYDSNQQQYIEQDVTAGDGSTIVGRVTRELKTIHLPDVHAEPGFSKEFIAATGLRTGLAVPLLHEATLVGTLALWRRESKPYTPKQIALIETFADQAVIAMENTRLFEEVQARTRELAKTVEELEIASQHKSQFVANMSHELRTPLAAILGYAELMQEGFYEAQGPKSLDALTRIQSNGKHLLGLINTVLDIAKIESGQFTLNMGEYAVESVVETVRSATESLAQNKKLTLKTDVARKLPIGLGDEQRLTQVLLNLVGNAIKFTDTGEVRVLATAANGTFAVSVSDTGPGIPTDQLTRVFEQFHQVDSSNTKAKGGTGLGLAISKQIVEMHGGRIWVESTLGKGSVFHMELPTRADFRKVAS
jgi:GAF domain-containing protein/anti-sigma regulatory factor (Ser/Thr protein kinase)